MNYKLSQDRFYPLLDAVVEQGGTDLPETCQGEAITYKRPRREQVYTHGCRKHFMLLIPYDGIEQKEGLPVKEHEGMVTVCAEGDAVELWPRFQEDL